MVVLYYVTINLADITWSVINLGGADGWGVDSQILMTWVRIHL